MQYRHEYKHYLNYGDCLVLRPKLAAVMRPDPHVSESGRYRIRSLYFDNAENKALMEKVSGVSCREKFRIRYYNSDLSFIRLEKKVKRGDLGCKISAPVSKDQAERLISGDTSWMLSSGNALAAELYSKMKTQGLRPKTVVDYTREPFVCPAGNVRVTLDYDIRSGVFGTDFLSENLATVPVSPGLVLLEVKYDNFLPDYIRDIVQMKYRDEGSFSKYEACRKFG